ncbi:ABC transporter ATP-binding protein [Xanthobacter sp. KR7-225]|uniref:ABC transporter ATP-binding protein n=1 Tax=Xanthobacter sp. KR7-225 TaxID=3156613 RepID=UPI0032B35D0A
MLITRDLGGGYGGRDVLCAIDVEIGAGDTVAILGANTAGKTTLIRALAGLLPRVSGAILFQGQDITRVPAHERAALGIALVPEGRHVFAQMSVEDNLLVGAYHRRAERLTGDLDACFDMFPRLRERRTQRAGTLSGGEQQMVALGRALMSKPRLLLLDEPSHGLAPLMVEEVHRAIERVTAAGISVLLVEQNVVGALKLVRHAYVLEAGRITLSGTAAELSGNDEVRRAYLGI